MMYGAGGFGFGWVMMLIVWALLITGVIALVRWMARPREQMGQSPLDLLKARFAKGEIDQQEFDRVRKELNS